jgi:tetratricopeptide (TPR) repeat protein
MAYLALKRCAEGLLDIEKALSINPNYASAWDGRGSLNSCLGNVNQAIQDFKKALSLDGSLAVAHQNLGAAYYTLGTYSKSLDEYNLAIAIDSTRSSAWAGRSLAFEGLMRFGDCIQSATKALEVNQKEWIAYTYRASCEVDLKKYDDAIKDYTNYFSRQPAGASDPHDLGMAHFRRGDIYYAQQDYSKAITDYILAEPLLGKDAQLYCKLAYTYFDVKQYQNVVDAGKLALGINPACGGKKLLQEMARSYYALGNNSEALVYINQVFDTGPDVIDYYYRGIILQAVGKNDKAIDDFKYFLSNNSSGPEVEDAKARLKKLES